MTENLKHCAVCNRDLPISAFGRDRSRRDGRCNRCKRCDSARGRAYYARHAERIRPIARERERRRREDAQ